MRGSLPWRYIVTPYSPLGSMSEHNLTMTHPRHPYQCGTCSQSYSRIDHLQRHVRCLGFIDVLTLADTHEKPYQCPVCNKAFGRIDLLRRHSALHGSQPQKPRASPAVRTSQACSACADAHLRCDDEKPCKRCRRRGLSCVFRADNKPPSETMSDAPASSETALSDTAASAIVMATPSDSLWESMELNEPEYELNGNELDLAEPDQPDLSDLFGSGTRTPHGLIAFGLETNLDLSMVDLTFLETYNSRIPFEEAPLPMDNIPFAYASASEGDRSMSRLRWRFVPAPHDHGWLEHGNLLLSDPALTLTPRSLEQQQKQPPTESLDLACRDRILGIVLGQLKHPLSAALSSFPSVQLLDMLIRYFLTSPVSNASSWIHRPVFRPGSMCPELLLAMAGAGAVLTPDPSLRKLGFAMQEVVRLQLPAVFERDNTTVRDLDRHQAYLIYLEIGLWSGNSRKIEISEAFRQPLITMVRRGGLFHHSAYRSAETLPVSPEDAGEALDRKWRAWSRQEASKRLVYQLFRLEAQVSIALLTNPLISYAEMALPLPCPPALWDAPCAQRWKELYCTMEPPTHPPTLTAALANLDLLEESRMICDPDLAGSAILHCVWGLVWEYRQLSGLLSHGTPTASAGAPARYWDSSGLLMASRRQQLTTMLDCFSMAHAAAPTSGEQHVIRMHMQMSLEEIETLATSDHPRRACAALQKWFHQQTPSEPRRAVWHAGQVIRSAHALPPQGLRDFMAIAMYQATLVLWAYGMASTWLFPLADASPPSPASTPLVCLDGPETEETNRYIALGRGVPCLQGSEAEGVPLTNSCGVLDLAISLMARNHQVDSQPPLVANLIHLLGKLRDASS
ncbi:hypothetical protein ASPZODRAFT_96356 [Penicilliopsis zonata CBS 506.65]|uniref:C2H2-type domain-containing protein n=1 Tax=Penicilliopsis zonata CBS 506.65 TaxID=1073090 RepID=A0A1L9SJM6_9EURO|nr:hypothetical protein ASPZODRAFT_96356 [Penicilliopsis zonata CBS 506.65]OJJ47367.1 hypothetical protein ASPZODRAFT_96356 [Penicilliopsis zonata CBS 506.65]